MTNVAGQRLLKADQERELALRWRVLGDRKAADEIVTKHLRLAIVPPAAKSRPRHSRPRAHTELWAVASAATLNSR
jgi:hypothetical protein